MAVAAEAMARTARGVAPGRRVLQAIAAAGVVAAGASVALALTSDHVNEPVVRSGLIDWITLPYILSGVIAWSRRPQSRLGPLMVAAGLLSLLSPLPWAGTDGAFTLGPSLHLVSLPLFLHVFLAFPTADP